MRQPTDSSCSTCSPKREKSAARMDGSISTMGKTRLAQCYHGGEKAISGVAAGKAEGGLDRVEALDDGFVLFGFEGASGVEQAAPGLKVIEGAREDFALAGLKRSEIVGAKPPLDFGVAREGAGAGAGGVDENAVEFRVERK